MSKKLSNVWIIQGKILRFHTLLNILNRKDGFKVLYPHITPNFAHNFDFASLKIANTKNLVILLQDLE
ncbi:MAG TPA: hypothetical protein DCK81_04580 [Clostridiales bacterium UBA9856]|jgi:hypothetical protein|nr:hypothetical protein [Clostridiales bacterium UBA9856]